MGEGALARADAQVGPPSTSPVAAGTLPSGDRDAPAVQHPTDARFPRRQGRLKELGMHLPSATGAFMLSAFMPAPCQLFGAWRCGDSEIAGDSTTGDRRPP